MATDAEDYSHLGARDLQRIAKLASAPELQLEIARRGRAAALKNLARNPRANTEALSVAYSSTDDQSVRRELALNLNADLRSFEPEDVAYGAAELLRMAVSERNRELRERYRERAHSVAKADWFNDSIFEGLQELRTAELDRKSYSFNSEGEILDIAMANPANELSPAAVLIYAKSSPRAASIALEAGRVAPDQLEALPATSARFGHVADPAVLIRAAELSAAGHWDEPTQDPWGRADPYGRPARTVAESIVANPSAPAEALQTLVGNPRVPSVLLYRHPQLSESSREELEGTDPSVQSVLRINAALGGRTEQELRDELTISHRSTSTARGYHSTDRQLDKDLIEAYGLSKGDVERLMGGDGMFYSYNPEIGHYGGFLDSGD